jgi:hypothetical protein
MARGKQPADQWRDGIAALCGRVNVSWQTVVMMSKSWRCLLLSSLSWSWGTPVRASIVTQCHEQLISSLGTVLGTGWAFNQTGVLVDLIFDLTLQELADK